MMDGCGVCRVQTLNEPRYILYENDDWVVVLRTDDQEYLGKSVVSLKSHISTVSSLADEQWLSLGEVTRWLESHLNTAFSPTHFNWQCLMNDGAASGIKHVHWHCTPRYNDPIKFAGERFVDSRWPKSCQRVSPKELADFQLEEIVVKVKHG